MENEKKKPFLVDVPVKIGIWIRPEQQMMQYEVIRQARPSVLFLSSDGGRNEAEWEAIRKNRKLYDEGIDWDCQVYRLYKENNCGLYHMALEINRLIWSHVDRCIFLEDDVLPSISYFQFCAELLEYYKDDTRVGMICGMNHCETWDAGNADYFFSKRGSIWGVARWKRTYELNWNIGYYQDPYARNVLREYIKDMPDLQKQTREVAEKGEYLWMCLE